MFAKNILMKVLFTILILSLFSNCKNIVETKNDVKEIAKEKIELDSIAIIQKLGMMPPGQIVDVKEGNILLPFNYSIDNSNGMYVFKWNLGDLIIDSDSTNYSHYSFENSIPYKGYIGFEGKLHFIETIDSTAITIGKFKKNHSELYKKIYFSDKESVIFKAQNGAIAVLYFKYIKSKKLFSVFFKENKGLGFKPTEKELLDLAVTQLRVAKNFYKTKGNIELKNWNNFRSSLSILDKKVFRGIYTDILKSIDTLETDKVYTPKIDGNWNLISIINVGTETNKLWNAINRIEKTKKKNFQKIYNTELSDQIAYLRSYDNFIKSEYKNDSSIILSKESRYSKLKDYAVFNKVIINNKEVIIFTGGWQNFGKVNSKEMAYFYLNLFNNFTDL